MKRSSVWTLVLVVPLLAVAVLLPLRARAEAAEARNAAVRAELAAIEARADAAFLEDIDGQMKVIKGALETLTTKIEDPKEKKTCLEAFTKLEQAFMTCKDLTPPKAGNVKEAEKDAFIAEYRRFQIDAVKGCLDAEKKFLEGKAKDAKKLVRDVEALKGKGHGKYK